MTEKRVLCFGDSLTEGYQSMMCEFTPYSAELSKLLGPAVPVLTSGVCGEKTGKMLHRLDGVLANPAVGTPKVVVILGGTNDLSSEPTANIIANLSASNITIGKARDRAVLCDSQSRRCVAAYLYAAAGHGESTTDLAWDGQLSVYELGEKLLESERFATDATYAVTDIDVERIRLERLRMSTFRDTAAHYAEAIQEFRRIEFNLAPPVAQAVPLKRDIPRFPFVPDDPGMLDQDCFEAYNIQVKGLLTRLQSSGVKKIVIGVLVGGRDQRMHVSVDVMASGALEDTDPGE